MKHAECAEQNVKAAVPEIEQCRSNGPKQQVIENARARQGEWIELLRNGEDNMEVRHRQEFGSTLLEPGRSRCASTFRASAIAAGVPSEDLVPAVVTLLHVSAHGGRAAGTDRGESLPLSGSRSMGAEVRLNAVSYDRAEIALGWHEVQT